MAALRTRARGYALQALYSLDVNGPSADALSTNLTQFEFELEEEGREFARRLVALVGEHKETIDEEIQNASRNWRVERMATVDRNILRLSSAELLYDSDIPTRVIINEAIELAKRFGTTESAAFVNGILDRIATNVRDS